MMSIRRFSPLKRLLGFAIYCSLTGISAAHAAPVTSPTALAGGTIVDFESYALGTTGPIVTSGMAISATPANTPVASSLAYATQYPGIVTGNVFGLSDNIVFQILFDKPVATFGMGVFDPNFAGNVLTAYDVNGNVLETTTSNTINFPVGAPGGQWSTYVGFTYNAHVIKKITLAGINSDLLSIDNVAYQRVPGPLPILGAAAAFGYSRKLRKRLKDSNPSLSSHNGH